MALGEAIIDANGNAHEMLGLLPVTTSFATPKRHLGYRKLRALENAPWSGQFRGHEFHYASEIKRGAGKPLFAAGDATGAPLGEIGMIQGNVSGSYAHLIAPEA